MNEVPLSDGWTARPYVESGYCPTCREYWPCETYRALKSAVEEGNTK